MKTSSAPLSHLTSRLALASIVAALGLALTACNKKEEVAAKSSSAAAAPTPAKAIVATPASEVDLSSEEQRLSYGIGYNMGSDMGQQSDFKVDKVALMAGLEDGLSTLPTRIEKEQIQAAFQSIQQRMALGAAASAEKQLAEGAAFLATNKVRPGVVTTKSGLQYEVVTAGTGSQPEKTSTVVVSYRGTLLDGTEFDSSDAQGGSLEISLTQVIPGWAEGLQLMSVGSHWKFYISADLAYGQRGRPGIPGNSTLIFDVELFAIK